MTISERVNFSLIKNLKTFYDNFQTYRKREEGIWRRNEGEWRKEGEKRRGVG